MASVTAEARLTVPDTQPMVALLGSGDSLLRVVEDAFPDLDIHARGNLLTIVGAEPDVQLCEQVFVEMLAVLDTGLSLSPDAVERSIAMLRSGHDQPSSVLTANILSSRGRTIRAKLWGKSITLTRSTTTL